ncbi:Uncharacterised protein [Mycobacteroides abscessus subsp. abscessus]|nr:Uncharacterised protein [Mycobacteroides abscessus subsp. abscessus]
MRVLGTLDFKLSPRFGPVEEAIFQLLGHGYTRIHDLFEILYIFSEEVIAKGIEELTNAQLVEVNLLDASIKYSSVINELYKTCSGQVAFEVPEQEVELMENNFEIKNTRLIQEILYQMDTTAEFRQLSKSLQLIIAVGEQR